MGRCGWAEAGGWLVGNFWLSCACAKTSLPVMSWASPSAGADGVLCDCFLALFVLSAWKARRTVTPSHFWYILIVNAT